MFKCKYCESTAGYRIFKPFKNPYHKWEGDPKWAFHIEQKCANCHQHNNFLPQTEELMNELKNNVFMNLDLKERLPFADEQDAVNTDIE
jgi:hypothetical protein